MKSVLRVEIYCERTIMARVVTLGSHESSTKTTIIRPCFDISSSRYGSHYGTGVSKLEPFRTQNGGPIYKIMIYTIWLIVGGYHS